VSDPVEDGARAAAKRLAPDYGEELITDVETALRARHADPAADRYFDPVSLGILIVAIATLAWTVCNDRKDKSPGPSSDTVTRSVHAQLSQTFDIDVNHHQQVLEITVTETINSVRADQNNIK